MKRIGLLLLISALPFSVFSQESSVSGFGLGFQLNETGGDFGLGLNLHSPALIKESIQIRLRANAMYLEYANQEEITWEPYYTIMLGLSSVSTKISEAVALYGEGGVVLLLSSDTYSSSATEIGGYGIFGFEFYFADSFTYFLEAGGVGIGAVADKVENKPIYANGFLMSVGWRVKF